MQEGFNFLEIIKWSLLRLLHDQERDEPMKAGTTPQHDFVRPRHLAK